MSWHVVGALVIMTVQTITLWNNPVQCSREVQWDIRRGVFVDGERCRRVPDEDIEEAAFEEGQLREGIRDLLSDHMAASRVWWKLDCLLEPFGGLRGSLHHREAMNSGLDGPSALSALIR